MTDVPAAPVRKRRLVLRGELVGLSAMQTEDVPAFAKWHQDLEFTANLGTPGEVHTLEMRLDLFKQNSRVSPECAEFSVLECATGRLVGFGGLLDISRALTAKLFVGIGEADVQGMGFGREACRLLCEYGFFYRNLHAIRVEVHAYNKAALATYAGLGFKPAGRLRGACQLNGQRYDDMLMDLLRDEFEIRHIEALEQGS